MRRPWPALGCCARETTYLVTQEFLHCMKQTPNYTNLSLRTIERNITRVCNVYGCYVAFGTVHQIVYDRLGAKFQHNVTRLTPCGMSWQERGRKTICTVEDMNVLTMEALLSELWLRCLCSRYLEHVF